MAQRTRHVPLDERDPHTVRAVVLARMSDPNAKNVSMETQIEACEAFIARMGWPKPTLGPFTDKASGFYNVEREGLGEVERLISHRTVHCVVALNFERLARSMERRYAALYHARRFGVEYRFAELLPDGKYAPDAMGKMIAGVMDAYGELNRQKTIENMRRGKAKRTALGFPSGGRGGAPYGFRRTTKYDTTRYWAEREDEADVLRWMFSWLAEMADCGDPRGSLRGVVKELHRRGLRTRAGYTWSAQTVKEKLNNPLYAGRGRLNRWKTLREDRTDELTGETYNFAVSGPRDLAETFPIGPDMVPTLVDPELFDRVQAILDKPNPSGGRLGREQPGHPDEATLLHSGFLRCALCGHAMVRYWRPPSKKHPSGVAYYRCSTDANQPDACTRHSIRAGAVEDYALRAVAYVLSDPAKILLLADAAEERLEDAQYVALKATTDLEAMQALAFEIDKELSDTRAAITALSKLPGQQATLEGLRAKVLELSARRDRALAEQSRLAPRRKHAEERQVFLHSLFTVRDRLTTREWMPMEHAEALLGEAPKELIGDTIDLGVQSWLDTPATDQWLEPSYRGAQGEREDQSEANTAYTVYALLRRAPYLRLRKVLRELEVTVKVKPPRSPEERAEQGKTPPWERIVVEVGNLVITGEALQAADRAGCPGVNNLDKVSHADNSDIAYPEVQVGGDHCRPRQSTTPSTSVTGSAQRPVNGCT
jgi:DNA invertase Pin-like site-specific DNA recombinase